MARDFSPALLQVPGVLADAPMNLWRRAQQSTAHRTQPCLCADCTVYVCFIIQEHLATETTQPEKPKIVPSGP